MQPGAPDPPGRPGARSRTSGPAALPVQLRWHRYRPFAAGFLFEQLADPEGGDLVDPQDQHRFTGVQRLTRVVDEFPRQQSLQPVRMCGVDDFFVQGCDPAVLQNKCPRELGGLAVWKCRDQGLAQDSRLLFIAGDFEPSNVDAIDPVADALARLAHQLVPVGLVLELSRQAQAPTVEVSSQRTVDGMGLVDVSGEHRRPPRGDERRRGAGRLNGAVRLAGASWGARHAPPQRPATCRYRYRGLSR